MCDKESPCGRLYRTTVLAETSSSRHGTLGSHRNISGTTDGMETECITTTSSTSDVGLYVGAFVSKSTSSS